MVRGEKKDGPSQPKRKIFKVCAYLLVIAFAAVTLYPIVYAFSVSISGRVAYESGSIVLLPKDVTLQAYDMVLHSKGFWIAYANTLFYTVVGTAWSMFISLTGAYALQKKSSSSAVNGTFAGVHHVVQRRHDSALSEL